MLNRLEAVLVALERRVGYVGELTTTGRRTGKPRTAIVGFVREGDARILLAAQGTDSAWVDNLRANPACLFEVRNRPAPFKAHELGDTEREAAIRRIRRRYLGDRRYGAGAAFRLTRV
jgi:deazaflavin-dependent oxidoreductase (nitroreductase family)